MHTSDQALNYLLLYARCAYQPSDIVLEVVLPFEPQVEDSFNKAARAAAAAIDGWGTLNQTTIQGFNIGYPAIVLMTAGRAESEVLARAALSNAPRHTNVFRHRIDSLLARGDDLADWHARTAFRHVGRKVL